MYGNDNRSQRYDYSDDWYEKTYNRSEGRPPGESYGCGCSSPTYVQTNQFHSCNQKYTNRDKGALMNKRQCYSRPCHCSCKRMNRSHRSCCRSWI